MKIYRNEQLREIIFPLGGIGSGCIGLSGSGHLVDWEIFNRPAKGSHNGATIRLAKRIRKEGCQGFLVGASGCALCSPCAIVEGKPCNFPEFQYSCMSAYCIFVKKLTDKCGIEYDCGDGLLAFFGMYVFD